MSVKDKKVTTSKGITLIALVVTIVVLLILAGVSITVLFGDTGIITMAQKAADQTNEAAEKDKDDLDKLNEYLTSGDWGGTDTPTDPKEHVNPEKGVIIPPQSDGKTNVDWKENVDGEEKIAKIPVGFSVVKDLKDAEGNMTDENNITNGLVISDVPNDDLDNTAGGNQFVWIPVDYSKFVIIEGFDSDTRSSWLEDLQEAGKETDAISTTESREMYQSVADNGGFYIARFEAGVKGVTTPITKDEEGNVPTNVTSLEEVEKLVSKKGVAPWNFIPWSISEKVGSDGLPGDDKENGAVKVARSMYTSAEYGVTSTLCYDVQWDAVMQFLEPQYINVPLEGQTEPVPSDSVVRNGEGKGNYSGVLALTGQYQQKHIYDLAGNVEEWTMGYYLDYVQYVEADCRVIRGGSYNDYRTAKVSASSRWPMGPDASGNDTVGFRQTLYL